MMVQVNWGYFLNPFNFATIILYGGRVDAENYLLG